MPSVERDDAIRRADRVVESASASYPQTLTREIAAIEAEIAAERFDAALRRCQNIAGEASSFGWPAAGAIAAVLRDLLEADATPKVREAMRPPLSALQLIVGEDRRELSRANQTLIDRLRAMASALLGDA